MSYQYPAIIFLIPFLTAICMPVVCRKKRDWCRPIALAAVCAMSAAALANLLNVLDVGESSYVFGGWLSSSSPAGVPIGIEWVNDGLASIMVVVVSLLASVCVIYSGPLVSRSLGTRVVHYHTLILLLISGLIGVVFAGDIFNLFVFLEVVALSAYALVGVRGGKALMVAFRYLILGTLGASFYLLGIVFFYAATGTLNMADMAQHLADNPQLMTSKAVIGGATFMFIGLGIKMALFPLHGWLPAAYARAPDAISPILAGLMTKVALYAWVRIMFWVLGAGTEIGYVHVLSLLGVLGALAAVMGALLALSQQDVKRMFAYGGISHIGLILIGVSQGNPTGFAGGMFYLINDAVMQAGLFFIAGAAIYRHQAHTVEEWSRLRGASPWMTAALVVLGMSMIGIPPTGGFFGKWYIILGAMEAGNYLAVGAVVLATLLTMAYFQRLFVSVFRDSQASPPVVRVETELSLRLSVGVTAVTIIILGLCSDPIISFFRNTASSLGL
jgi:multicomponent Na+:H+ antiporter subunit D